MLHLGHRRKPLNLSVANSVSSVWLWACMRWEGSENSADALFSLEHHEWWRDWGASHIYVLFHQLQGNPLSRQKAAKSLVLPENLGIGFLGQGEAVSYQQTYEMLVKGGVDYANVGQKPWGGFWNSLSSSFGNMTSWNKHTPRRCSDFAFAWAGALSARSSLPRVQLPEHAGGIPHLMFSPVLWASGPHIPLPTKLSLLGIPLIPPLIYTKLMAYPSKSPTSNPFLVMVIHPGWMPI